MMRISTKGRYALRMMLDLARNDRGANVSLKAIGARQGVPVKYLEAIMAILLHAGLVKSSRGKSGGYRLACPPSECTVAAVLKQAEGGLAPVACLSEDADPCPRSAICETLPLWRGLNRVITDYLESVTLEDLMTGRLEVPGTLPADGAEGCEPCCHLP